MTYYSDQVKAYQKQIADALSGKRLRDSIRQLQEKSKVGGGLKPLQPRGALSAKKKVGERSADSGTDYNEVSRGYHTTLRELRSSDGLFVLEWYAASRSTMDRGVFTWLDTG